MIRHVVMWRFLDEAHGKTKEENLDIVRERLLGLKNIIPEIRNMHVGKDETHSEMSYDMALMIDFDSKDDMATYQCHPEHVKISQYVKGARSDRACVDFEL